MRRLIFVILFGSAVVQAQPSGAATPPRWISLGGEYRARLEGVWGLRFAPDLDDGYYLSRLRVNLKLQPASWIGVFAQAQDSRVFWNSRVPDAPPYQDRVDLRQAYLDLGDPETHLVSVRAGRQELAFGEERLAGALNWTNTARSFDAARVTLHRGRVRLDAFAASVVQLRDGSFDQHRAGDNFHGAYLSIKLPDAKLEPYAFWRLSPLVRAEMGAAGKLNFRTWGVRAAGTARRAYEYGIELALQQGSWASDDMLAWAGHWRIGRKIANSKWNPKARIEYNFATGDGDPRDGERGTFDVLYPTPHDKYGLTDQVGWKNIHHVAGIFEAQPHKGLILQAKYHNWWLASARDGLYNAGGALLARDSSGRAGRRVGQEVDLQAIWNATRKLQLAGGVGHIFPGEFLKRTTPGHAFTFPYLSVACGF